jgi:hypothetical protein
MFGGSFRGGGAGGQDNGHVIREEDVEKDFKDIYNSEPYRKGKFLNKDFFRFFKLPLIIIVFLAASVIVLKFLFFHKADTLKAKKITEKNTVMPDKKRFSPAVFGYAGKKAANGGNGAAGIKIKESGKFNGKFKKETEKLSRDIKFNNGGTAYANAPSGTPPQINKKTVVFIKASYGKYILNKERGVKNLLSNNLPYNTNTAFKGGAEKEAAGGGPGISAVAVPQGTVINAYTKYKIFSYNTSVPVIAVSPSGYYRGGKAVFRKGDKFFGAVSVRHSLNRLNINFDKIIEKSGNSINIDAIAIMPDGSGGVKGDVHRHYAGNILTSIAQGIAGAASIFAGGGSGVNSSNPYTFQNQIRENVAQNELNSAQNGLNNYANANSNASITLPAGTPIKIIFLKPVYVNQIKQNK